MSSKMSDGLNIFFSTLFFSLLPYTASNAEDICASLSLRDAGVITVLDGNLTYRVSPCGPMNVTSVCDDPKAALCVYKEGDATEKYVPNAGSVNNVFEVSETNQIALIFKGGDRCSGNEAYKTVLLFICDEEARTDRFSILDDYHNCSFVITWLSRRSCNPSLPPRSTNDYISACILRVPEYFQVVHIRDFTSSSFYPVRAEDDSPKFFQVNLCSSVYGGSCPNPSPACEVDEETRLKTDLFPGGPASVYSHYSFNDKTATLTYDSPNTTVSFVFVCPISSTNDVRIKFEEDVTANSRRHITFKVLTSKLCLIPPVPCVAETPGGHRYDLTPLMRTEDPWITEDISLTICKPNDACKGIDTASCFGDVIIGQVVEGPKVRYPDAENEILTLTYPSSVPCEYGFNSSVEILFECDDIEYGPSFLTLDEFCGYHFEWKTPVACLDKRSPSEKDNCVIKDNIYGHTIYLKDLYQNKGDLLVQSFIDKVTFAINLCGNGLAGASSGGTCGPRSVVCKLNLTATAVDKYKPSTEIKHGISFGDSDQLKTTYEDNLITLNLKSNVTCMDTDTYSSTIIVKCDQSIEKSRPTIVSYEGGCSAMFIWKSSVVCKPYDEIPCSVPGPNNTVYDLSPLSLSSRNYIIPGVDHQYVLNICRSVVSSPFDVCPSRSAACYLDPATYPKGFKHPDPVSLGELAKGPFYDTKDQSLVLKYTMGSLCKFNNSVQTHYSTKIYFKCLSGHYDTSPEFLTSDECEYQFLWLTDSACARPVRSEESLMHCAIRDFFHPQLIHNFSSLSNASSPLSVSDNDGNLYSVNICDSLPNSSYGAEMTTTHGHIIGLGIARTKLNEVNNEIYLEYTDGDICEDERYLRHSTIIRFVCLSEGSPVSLRFVERRKCLTIFNLYSSIACGNKNVCGIQGKNGRFFDFTPLRKRDGGSYSVDGEWELNICQGAEICHPPEDRSQVAVCKRSSSSSGQITSAIRYTKFHFTEDLKLIYETDDKCNFNETYTASVSFQCDPDTFPGQPAKIENLSNCSTDFVMETALACTNVTTPFYYNFTSTCDIYHHGFNKYVDMSVIKPQTIEGGWKVSPCEMTGCSICHQNVSYGRLFSSHYDFKTRSLNVVYKSMEFCPRKTRRRSSEIWFQCDKRVKGQGRPKLLFMSGCHAILEWKTPAVCSPKPPVTSSSSFFRDTADPITFFLITMAFCVLCVFFFKVKCLPYFRKKRGTSTPSTVIYRRDLSGSGLGDSVRVPTFDREEEDDDQLIVA